MSGNDGSENDTINKINGTGEPYTPSGQALVLLSSLAGLVLVSLVFLWMSLSVYKGIMSKKTRSLSMSHRKSKFSKNENWSPKSVR